MIRRALVWGVVMWASWSWSSTGTAPLELIHDGLDGGYTILRREPVILHVPPADEALAMGDAQIIAELVIAEDPHAVVAIAHVVLNRARGRGQTVFQVVTAPGQFGSAGGPPAWPKSARWRREHAALIDAVLPLVIATLAGRTSDPTAGATHFHLAGSWTPPWAPAPDGWRLIGSHFFYQEARRQAGRGRQAAL